MPDVARAAGDPTYLLGELRRVGVVPVVTVDDAARAPDLVAALVAGGLSYVEITLRTAAGLDALRTAATSGAQLGAGTVTTAAEAERAIGAGAQFVVSPGLDEGVVRFCHDAGVPVVPGVATPTEVITARAWGLRAVKVFPVSSLGGVAFVRSLAAVWPDMEFLPTGGITLGDAADYLAVPSVAAVGGSWMVPAALLRDAAWDRVEELAREAAAVRGSAA